MTVLDKIFSFLGKYKVVSKILFYLLLVFLAFQNLMFFDYVAYRMAFAIVILLLAFFTAFPFSIFDKPIDKKHKIYALFLAVPLMFIFIFFNIGMRDPVYFIRLYTDNAFNTFKLIASLFCDLILAYWIGLSLSLSLFEKYKDRIIKLALVIGALGFINVMYLPLDSYIANINDFEFTVRNFIFYFVAFYISIVIVFTLSLARLKDKVFNVIYKILLAISVGSLIQYLFMNKHLPYLGLTDKTTVWDVPVLIINTLIWILIFVAVFLLPKLLKKDFDRAGNIISALILAYHFVSLVILLVLAPANAYSIKVQYFFDTKGQYTVSNNENVIVIIFDAYDNRMAKSDYLSNPGLYDGLNDFTMYTNTVSVFDSTVTSVNQFVGGCDFDNTLGLEEWLDSGWESDRTKSFYNSMHDAGYKCNCYNFDLPMVEKGYGKLDNIVKYDEPRELTVGYFDVNKYFDDFEALSFYRTMPYLVKNLISFAFNENTFHFYVVYDEVDRGYYYNQEYINHQKYVTIDDNVMMVNHLNGLHTPCDLEVESKNCFIIMNNLIDQFKELGIYDNSTIIFMSDHGSHRQYVNSDGSSPLFIVKKPNESHDKILLDHSQISLEDFMGTIAVNAGLPDPEKYGTSIYDFEGVTDRVRYTYERVYDSDYPMVYSKGHLPYMIKYNAFAKYVILNDPEEIKGINPFEEDIEILPMKEYFG